LLIDCSSNNLTNLDLSQNIVLSSLTCDGNQLTTLDVTQNPVLTDLVCFNNQLTTLNFMQNSIRTLFCSYNLLTSLDIALEPSTQSFLQCGSNSLTCLRVSNITENSCLALNTINNPDLNCITIDANSLSSFPSSCLITNIDSWTSIDTTSCNDGCTLVGINDIQESIPANIHPNPTTEQVTISLEEAKTGILIIRNSLGQIVLQETFTNTNQLDVSLNEPDGIYFLQIETDGQVITRKIIKQ
jgi:hypothetical protein